MIRKTQKNYRRERYTWLRGRSLRHEETVLRETWWLLFIPLYSRETIERTTI